MNQSDEKDIQYPCFSNSKGEKCDLHFTFQNEVTKNKRDLDKLESKTTHKLEELRESIESFRNEFKEYVFERKHMEKDYGRVEETTKSNTIDISDIKSSLKDVVNHYDNVNKSIFEINENIKLLSDNIRAIDKTILSKQDVIDIVENRLLIEKSRGTDRLFDSLPAKISAGVAFLSFIAFFTLKIVVLLLSL
jgi:chromosome segregation ATPase